MLKPITQLMKCQQRIKCHQFISRRYLDLNKKFYKLATVFKNDNQQYEIKLDNRKLKTPKGNLFEVKNESLAHLIAQEWNSQQEKINRTEMHLTSLVNTQLDNPLNLAKEQIVDKLVDQLASDTICYRLEEPEELKEYLIENWDPLVKWFEMTFECKLPVTTSVFLDDIPEQTKTSVKRYLSSFEFRSLLGLQFVYDNLKSIVLTLALANKRLTVDEAVQLSRLEQEFQIEKWGNVEWAHDVDLNLLRSRVSSGLIYFILNNELHNFEHCKVNQ